MKTKEINKLKPEDLVKKESELRLELSTLKGQASTGTPPKNPGRIRQIRRTLARIITLHKQKNKEDKKLNA
jgi:large subunit ribosomal protein L29